ncbi:MAG: hypothetical protein R2702_13525 [Acidimicrobiales bacterium]
MATIVPPRPAAPVPAGAAVDGEAVDRAAREHRDRPDALPRSIATLLHATAALVWAGAFTFYLRVWLGPRESDGSIGRSVREVVGGTADAPFQYRILVPQLLDRLHDALGWPYGYGEMVVDLVALTVAVAVTAALLRRLGLEVWVLAVALVGAQLTIGAMWWGKTETYAALAAATVGLWAVLDDRRRRWLPLLAAAAVLAGTRTDLLLALGIAALARWALAGRERRDLVAGAGLVAAGLAATVALKLAYPTATYDEAAGMLQVEHNLQPLTLLVVLAFLLPTLGPYLLVRSQPMLRAAIAGHRRWMVPTLALVAAEVGSVLVVGRADEVRLFLPIAPALGIVGVVGWRAVLGPHLAREWSTAARG